MWDHYDSSVYNMQLFVTLRLNSNFADMQFSRLSAKYKQKRCNTFGKNFDIDLELDSWIEIFWKTVNLSLNLNIIKLFFFGSFASWTCVQVICLKELDQTYKSNLLLCCKQCFIKRTISWSFLMQYWCRLPWKIYSQHLYWKYIPKLESCLSRCFQFAGDELVWTLCGSLIHFFQK